MAIERQPRRERIEVRATSEEKQLIAAAAAESGKDMTGFVMGEILPAAQKVMERAQRILVSERDYQAILDALENPPEPTPRLLAAFQRRHERLAGD